MNTIEAIRHRISANKFDTTRSLSEADIRELIQIATEAPSSLNIQHWRFVAVTKAEAKKRLKARVGETVDVLVEGTHPDTDLLLVGRMATQAIEVDGQVLINEGATRPGEIVKVEIAEVAGYDLVGGIVG